MPAAILTPHWALLLAPGAPLCGWQPHRWHSNRERELCALLISLGNLWNLCLYPCLLEQLVLACVVLVPPCLFPIPLSDWVKGSCESGWLLQQAGHGGSLVDLTHSQQHVLPGLCPPFNSVPGLALGPWGGRVETCSEVQWWQQFPSTRIPCRGGPCFTGTRRRQTLSLSDDPLCAHTKARVRHLLLKLWSSCSALEF